MSAEEKYSIKEKYYTKALRYMSNATEALKKAHKYGKYYEDKKYVKTACGIAYSGVLVALNAYFRLKDIPQPKNRASKEYYIDNLAKVDKQLLISYDVAYNVLHLWGYYDGTTDVVVIKRGFQEANFIINKIKPQH